MTKHKKTKTKKKMDQFISGLRQLADVVYDGDEADEADDDVVVVGERENLNPGDFVIEMRESPKMSPEIEEISDSDTENEESFSEEESDSEDSENEEMEKLAAQYKFLERIEHEPCDIYLCGLPACGKSTVGNALQRELQCRFVSKPHLSHVYCSSDENEPTSFWYEAKKNPKTGWAQLLANSMCQKVRAYTSFSKPAGRSRFNLIESSVQEDLHAWVPFTRAMEYLDSKQHFTLVHSIAPNIVDQLQDARVFRPFKIFIYLNVSAAECLRRFEKRSAAYSEKSLRAQRDAQKNVDTNVEQYAPSSSTTTFNAVSSSSNEELDYYDSTQPPLTLAEYRELQRCYHAMFAGSTSSFMKKHTIISVNYNDSSFSEEKLETIVQEIFADIQTAVQMRRKRMIRTYKLESLLYRLGQDVSQIEKTSNAFNNYQKGDLIVVTRHDGSKSLVRRRFDEYYDSLGRVVTEEIEEVSDVDDSEIASADLAVAHGQNAHTPNEKNEFTVVVMGQEIVDDSEMIHYDFAEQRARQIEKFRKQE